MHMHMQLRAVYCTVYKYEHLRVQVQVRCCTSSACVLVQYCISCVELVQRGWQRAQYIGTMLTACMCARSTPKEAPPPAEEMLAWNTMSPVALVRQLRDRLVASLEQHRHDQLVKYGALSVCLLDICRVPRRDVTVTVTVTVIRLHVLVRVQGKCKCNVLV